MQKRVQIAAFVVLAVVVVALYGWSRYDPNAWNKKRSQNLKELSLNIEYECPMARFGELEDGGKQVCLHSFTPNLKNCIIYSIGVDGEWTFDQAIAAMGCQIYAFDPFIPHDTGDNFMNDPNIHYYKIGLSALDSPPGSKFMSLRQMMKMLGHTEITILKIDIESSEWPVLEAALTDESYDFGNQIQMLLMEVHFYDDSKIEKHAAALRAFTRKHDMYLYYIEENPRSCEYMPNRNVYRCIEVAYSKRVARSSSKPATTDISSSSAAASATPRAP
eukprot:TRINITY_DN7895_c0_g1_i1.p1 TRINITY_DN7895_c0_g1~~TRINITY_DN7895_c0_g1_i1.p1  ORF type:complete len:275 (+),score=55.64 TRINITY_DN7895_c0_g1_i1:109-933(+)